MPNYTKTTDFTAKDALPTGNTGKIIRGTEFDVEFNAIASAISSKADTASPSISSPDLTGTPTADTATAGTNTRQIASTAFVTTAVTNERTATATLTNKTLTSPTINSSTIVDATLSGTTAIGNGATLTTPAFSLSSGKTFGLATSDTLNSNSGVGYFSSTAASTMGVLSISTQSSGIGCATTNTGTDIGGGNFWHATDTNWNTFNTYAAIATATYGGYFVDAGSGEAGVIASAGYDFYAYGTGTNYGPFTGAHDALLAKGITIQQGDIVVDTGFSIKKNISNTISKVELSSQVNQKGALGVFVNVNNEHKPVALCADIEMDGSFVVNIDSQYTELLSENDICVVNAVGEGQVNVCGEGGDIEVGDLIVTSSIAGKGMKQADDVIRSYTVAKAREAVTFASATEVKQIACIYLAG